MISSYRVKIRFISIVIRFIFWCFQNTYLTNQHIAIRSIVEKLLDTELLAQQSEWKKKVKEIRDIIEKVNT